MRKGLLYAAAAAAAIVTLSADLAGPDWAGPGLASDKISAETQALRTLTLATPCTPAQALAVRSFMGALLAGAQAYAQANGASETPPPLMRGLGNAHFAVATSNPQAQAYFDQGLRMLHGFNHAEAARAFREAQRIDAACGMCYWGEAFALGPNINAPMNAADNPRAFEAARAAAANASNATPLEKALIEAMQLRYVRHAPESRAGLDGAFADAMAAVADQYPDSDFAQTFAAEAAMDTQPWDYWQNAGREPKGRIGPAIARIERVLARSPNDSGAIHLYIHLVEASTDPWRAEDDARRLEPLTPAAGHLVHMPAHIYYRIGRFRDSMRLNVAASAADEAFMRTAHPSPMYQYGYYTHNLHFVLTSAAMGGDGRTALAWAEKLDAALPMEMAASVPIAQPVKAAPWFARAQFGSPDAILAAGEPPAGVAYVTGAWRYARGVALARLGRPAEARSEAAALERLIATSDFSVMNAQGVPAQDVLGVYRLVLIARADMAERKWNDAKAHLEQALEVQQRVPYMEPPYVYYPVRRTLGAVYLLNGQPALAESEFLRTLIESPSDSYAYWGLAEARKARRDFAGESAARHQFNAVFFGQTRGLSAMNL
ncbi:MAG: hypothetical protein JNJ73_09185 [Hyphomonadaceae bacterium]|nr:hypothetical protein [Hyphomonadaceae bacterium]